MITAKNKNGDIVSAMSYSRACPARYTIKVFNGKITSFDDIKPLKVFRTQTAASYCILNDCKSNPQLLSYRFSKYGTKTPKGEFLYLPAQNMTVLRIPVGGFNI